MHMGGKEFTESGDLIEKLSAVVQAQGGMFEFLLHPVTSVPRQRPLIVNHMVMSLVCHVDQQVARQQETASHNYWYVLESPQPEIWIEPGLHNFFVVAYSSLASGIQLEELANRLDLDVNDVHQNLTNLRLLGLVKLVDGMDTVRLDGGNLHEQISRKSNEFLRAARAVEEINRVTGKLPPIKK
jgi:predicted Rossmann fold nucleotide-binding protein DprA/Smf involved in DNA uptake